MNVWRLFSRAPEVKCLGLAESGRRTPPIIGGVTCEAYYCLRMYSMPNVTGI